MRSERHITDWLRAKCVIPRGSRVVLGIGDDCAIYRPQGSIEDLLFTSDMFLEDIHFRRSTHTAREVGRVAMARSISDIAAMGGDPRFALVSLSVPEWADDRWVRSFFHELTGTAKSAGAVLAGGDLSHSDKLACDVTVCGAVPTKQALLRSGAKPGDALFVSGLLGGSALGLVTGRGRAWRRHTRPEPRIALGRFIRTKLRASSAMDLSDGLSLDLQRLCLASGVAAEISSPPVFPGASVEQALHGGEDYELLFTAGPRVTVPRSFEGVPLTRIGVITPERAGLVTLHGAPLRALGHDHFAAKEASLK